MYGVSLLEIKITSCVGEKKTLIGNTGMVPGFVYLVPNPVDTFHGYACMPPETALAMAIESSFLENEIYPGVVLGGLAGVAYLVPNPLITSHAYTCIPTDMTSTL